MHFNRQTPVIAEAGSLTVGVSVCQTLALWLKLGRKAMIDAPGCFTEILAQDGRPACLIIYPRAEASSWV